MDGKLALVTGGNAGIGYATCRGLLERGAEVIMASRSEERANEACAELRRDLGNDISLSFVPLDLGDLDAVATTAETLQNRNIDILLANAGLWPRAYSTSAQGHEIAFATNVLGHHLLIRRLEKQLSPGARVVIVTGEIYFITSACTPDYTYKSGFGGMLAYCRSKLGNLWQSAKLAELYPHYTVAAVHPGVVSSNLGKQERGVKGSETTQAGPMIDCRLGAQTSLWCATQPDVVSGGYYNNVLGLVELQPNDPARNIDGANQLWQTCEHLCHQWLQ
ncbi:MAG: SDR family NAD(P)-dependent oxidoreductase [Proteobacteria bacterium]|jgi:NAD(P)-dependent dehydrogenase (short-subunit alcohol dehydrogenase family)|nr:SDR family NAD(P)-dependent oxidoreductase [Pseudomonadota bacterium]